MKPVVLVTEAKSILSKASGFIDAFDYTLNPYRGCVFGCSYCYAKFSFSNNRSQQEWGQWVEVKRNAVELLHKKRDLQHARIYMSSVTDPYQPVEREFRLTRGLLEALLPHQPRLVIQTRSPLVSRDGDLLAQFEHCRVHMTVGTDDDAIRRDFEPGCASVEQRLEALSKLRSAGVETAVTATPLLPLRDPLSFSRRLRSLGVGRLVVQFFHAGNAGWGAARTGSEAWTTAQIYGWDSAAYLQAVEALRSEWPDLLEGQAGFIPV